MRKLAACWLTAAFALAATATPVAASDAESSGTASSPSLLASGQRHVQQFVTGRAAEARRSQDTATAGDDAGTFFRSPKGMAVLVLVAAGTAYMFYSKVHDRVRSPIRD